MHAFIIELIWLHAFILGNEPRTIVDIGSIADYFTDTTIA
jgi:hypothetical protein